MARQPSTYTIYKITSPEEKIYVGVTKNTLLARLRQHFTLALKRPTYPMYESMLTHNFKGFVIEPLERCMGRAEALLLEREYIAAIGIENLYNTSTGGSPGNPNGFKVYNAKWRADNPKEAWKITHRAMRCAAAANTTSGVKKELREGREARTLKEKLLEKHKRKYARRQKAVTNIWAQRSELQTEEIGAKISTSLKNKHLADTDYRANNLVKLSSARDNIDRKKQGAAASRGLKKYWEDLKKDPVKYEQVMAAKKQKLKDHYTK